MTGKLLLYCIFRNEGRGIPDLPVGVRGQPLHIVRTDVLAAGVSDYDPSEPAVSVADALTYHNVIASVHSERTVIPIRMGTVFCEPVDIEKMLESRRDRYLALLNELDGTEELGLKIILSREQLERHAKTDLPHQHETNVAASSSPGKSFLHRRQVFYREKNLLNKLTESLVETLLQPFSGLFRKTRRETAAEWDVRPEGSDIIVSLYFLVPKASVSSFRAVFHELVSLLTYKMLLTGPWPPYNFVSSADFSAKEIDLY